MEPVEFEHQNIVIAKDQPQYKPLPALKITGPDGAMVSCWKMSFIERIKTLFTGRIWVCVMTFNKPYPPTLISTDRKEIYYHSDDKKSMREKLLDFYTDGCVTLSEFCRIVKYKY